VALEPEPQKWSHLLMDKNFGGIAVVHTEADILSDPTLALEDVDMTLDTWAVKYIRTVELFEKSSRIDITHAYQKARWSGLLEGAIASTSRKVLADMLTPFLADSFQDKLRDSRFAVLPAEYIQQWAVSFGNAEPEYTGGYK
jgi:hypothetical protein